jgi:siroheme synthase
MEQGRSPATPAAYVARATTREQEVVVGTLADLPARVAHVDPSAPALVFVGDVVSVRSKIAWFDASGRTNF